MTASGKPQQRCYSEITTSHQHQLIYTLGTGISQTPILTAASSPTMNNERFFRCFFLKEKPIKSSSFKSLKIEDHTCSEQLYKCMSNMLSRILNHIYLRNFNSYHKINLLDNMINIDAIFTKASYAILLSNGSTIKLYIKCYTFS